MSDELGALRAKLATEIPVTLHLGLEVIGHDAGGLTLAAPLSNERQPPGNGLRRERQRRCHVGWVGVGMAEAPTVGP